MSGGVFRDRALATPRHSDPEAIKKRKHAGQDLIEFSQQPGMIGLRRVRLQVPALALALEHNISAKLRCE